MAPTLLLRDVHLGPGGRRTHVRIVGGRVVELTDDPRTDGEEVVDGAGRTLLPGLWDAHVHSVQWAQARRRLDVTAARSARHAADIVADRVRILAMPAHGVVEGYGFRDALWPDAMHKDLLEAAIPGVAIALQSNDIHTLWCSPAALGLLGLDHPTGVLREQDCYAAVAALPRPDAGTVDAWVGAAGAEAAARGVTGFLDFEYADGVADWGRRAWEAGPGLRVAVALALPHVDAAVRAGLRTGDPVPGTAGLVEVGPVKVFADGSLNTRTAWCHDPYPGTTDHGLPQARPTDLVAAMRQWSADGLEVAVHAIGDRAVTTALDAFEAVGCRGRIEHAQLVRPADVARAARPGLVLGVQPAHAPDDRDVADRHWAGRTAAAFAYASLAAAGARLEIGSDAPVAPADPWDGIASAITRTDDGRPPWHPEQALPLPLALAAASRGRTGVHVGDVADLTLVDADPATLSPADLRVIGVSGTLVAGRWVHREL